MSSAPQLTCKLIFAQFLVQGSGNHLKGVLAVKRHKDYWADASSCSENPTSFPCDF